MNDTMALPPRASRILWAVCKRYGVEAESILIPNPRLSEVGVARRAAIAELAEAKDGDERAIFELADIAAWFGVSYHRVYRCRRRSAGFEKRKRRPVPEGRRR